MAKKLIEVYERNTSSDEAKPEGKQTFVSGHWRTYGGEKKVKPEKNVEQKKIKESKKSSASKGLGDQKAPLRSMSILNAKIAKNTAVLPSMAKDINTMRTNLDKFLGSVGSDGGGFGSPNLFGKGKRNRRVGKQNPRMGKKGIILGALGIGAVGAAGYVAAEAYGEKTAESPERKKEREDKEAKKIDAGEIPAPQDTTQTPIETPAPSVEATPTPAPAPTPLSPMLQNMMPGATLRQQAGLPAMIPTTPSAAPVAPPLRPGEVSGKIRRTDSSAGGGRGNVNPELVRGTDIEVPSNVIRDAQGNPVRTQDGGFVISGQPDVSIPNPPAPVPVRPAPTPTRPTPTPSRPTPTRPQEGMVKREGGLKAVLNYAESSSYEQLVYPKPEYRGTKTFSSGHDLDQYTNERKRKGLAQEEGAPSKAPLTDMTLQEVLNYQTQMIKSGKYPSSAVGKYQIIKGTLQDGIKALKLNLNDKFDEKMQDKLYEEWLIGKKRTAVRDYISGKSDDLNAAMIDMAKEFASFPVPVDMKGDKRLLKAGESYYADVAGNKAHVTIEQSAKALMEERAKKAAKFNPEVRLALNNTGTMVASASAQNAATRTEAARPQVVASPPMQGSGSSSVSASGGSSSTRPRTDHTQALVRRQTSGS